MNEQDVADLIVRLCTLAGDPDGVAEAYEVNATLMKVPSELFVRAARLATQRIAAICQDEPWLQRCMQDVSDLLNRRPQ